MKRIYFNILIFLLCNFLFATPLLGIWDIKFEDTKSEVIHKMNERGWEISKNLTASWGNVDEETANIWFNIGFSGDNFLTFTKENGTYGNQEVYFIAFDFRYDHLFKIRVFPKSTSPNEINFIHKAILEKYELKKTDKYNEFVSENNNVYLKEYSPDFGEYFVFLDKNNKTQKIIDDL